MLSVYHTISGQFFMYLIECRGRLTCILFHLTVVSHSKSRIEINLNKKEIYIYAFLPTVQ